MQLPIDALQTRDVQFAVKALNTLYGLRNKLRRIECGPSADSVGRGLDDLTRMFTTEWIDSDCRFEMHDPVGEPYSETRSDCEASIAGESIDDLVIVQTMKPIIRRVMKEGTGESSIVIQKGVVVARNKHEMEEPNG